MSSDWGKRVWERLDGHDAAIEDVRKSAEYPALARKTDAQLERAIRRAAHISVTVPLNLYADPSPTPAAHASSHLAGASDPIFTTQAYTMTNSSTLRALDVTALTAVDADVQKIANVLATLLADLAAYKVPTL